MHFVTTLQSSGQAFPMTTLIIGMRSIENRTSSMSENTSCSNFDLLLSVHMNNGSLSVCD